MIEYELDWSDTPEYRRSPMHMTNEEFIKVLTGLSIKEIHESNPTDRGYSGQDFVKTFKKLGFNTSERFEKFDPSTDKPVLMRGSWTEKKYWSAWIYYNGKVNGMWTLEEFAKYWPDIKITSMLKVWI